MRVFYLLIFLCGMVTTNIETQTLPKAEMAKKGYSVALRNDVELIEVESYTPSSVMLIVHLKLELLNNGSKPVIFLEAKPPELRGGALAKSREDFSSFKYLALNYYGESVNTSSEWTVLRKALNQPSPPPDKVRVLVPNESWKWEGRVQISLPKSGKNSFFDKNESWENIKGLQVVWLRAICQVWSLNLEPKSKDRTELTFGKKLQKQWKNVGVLLLDDIPSEPIALDLKTAVVR